MEWEHKGMRFAVSTQEMGPLVMASARVAATGPYVRIRPFSALGTDRDEAIETPEEADPAGVPAPALTRGGEGEGGLVGRSVGVGLGLWSFGDKKAAGPNRRQESRRSQSAARKPPLLHRGRVITVAVPDVQPLVPEQFDLDLPELAVTGTVSGNVRQAVLGPELFVDEIEGLLQSVGGVGKESSSARLAGEIPQDLLPLLLLIGSEAGWWPML